MVAAAVAALPAGRQCGRCGRRAGRGGGCAGRGARHERKLPRVLWVRVRVRGVQVHILCGRIVTGLTQWVCGDEVGGRRPQRRSGPGACTPARWSARRAVGARAEARLSRREAYCARGPGRAERSKARARSRGVTTDSCQILLIRKPWHGSYDTMCRNRTKSARRPLARKRGGMPSCHLSA